MPTSIWPPASSTPVTASANDGAAVTLGLQFTTKADGQITALRFYKGQGNTGTHTGIVWDKNGKILASIVFLHETTSGWQEQALPVPVPIKANATYTIGYFAPKGHYAYTHNDLPSNNGVLFANKGVYHYGSAPTLPTQTFMNSNYWIGLGFVAAPSPPPPTPPVGRTRYVSPTGNDSADGSQATPWLTPQHAADQSVPGDLIIVLAGNYTGFNITVSGTPTSQITYRGQGAVINVPITFGGNTFGINSSGGSYLTIEGFTFSPQEGQIEWYAGVRLGGTPLAFALGNIIQNNVTNMRQVNVSTTPDKYSIYSSWQDGIIVRGNSTSGGYNTGIYTANSAKNYIIRGNNVANCGGNGIHNNGDASQGGPGLNSNALIEGNTITNVGFGIGGQAISCDGVINSRIQNNLIYNVLAKGISLFVVNATSGSVGNIVVNNTISTAGSGVPLRINNDCPNNTFLNNILVATSASAGFVDAEESALNGGVGMIFDYNVTYGVPMVGSVQRNDWKTTYGFDAHTTASTPTAIFVSPSDFRPKSPGPAIDAGTATNAPSTDILGNHRPNGAGFDIGAYEV